MSRFRRLASSQKRCGCTVTLFTDGSLKKKLCERHYKAMARRHGLVVP